jgi:hypothetical protein
MAATSHRPKNPKPGLGIGIADSMGRGGMQSLQNSADWPAQHAIVSSLVDGNLVRLSVLVFRQQEKLKQVAPHSPDQFSQYIVSAYFSWTNPCV